MFEKRNRKHGKIDKLTPELKAVVEQMLLSGSTYTEIVNYLSDNGVGISLASVCRYAQGFNASMETLQIAQTNFNRMMGEIERYPELDTTEVILRLASQNLVNALIEKKPEEWEEVSVDRMLQQVNGLVRAAAYKKRIEIQNKDDISGGLDEIKLVMFKALATERPELYKQLTEFLNIKKEEGF